MARLPTYAKTTALLARALKTSPERLAAAFRPAGIEDLAQILALRAGIFGTALHWNDPHYLRWRYRFGRAQHGRGECWVVELDGRVLGLVGAEEIAVLHQGNEVPGLSVMDIAVQAELEGVGLGVWMAMRLCEQNDCVLAIGSNANSRAIVSRVFSRVPDRRSYAHMIDFRPLLQRRLKPRWLAGLAAALARAGLAAWRGSARALCDDAIEVRPVHRFEADIEILFAQSVLPHEIALARSAAFLNWRLFDSPRTTYAVWGARRQSKWAGYIAVQTRCGPDGTKTLVIEDLLTRAGAGGDAVLRALLCKALALAVAEGCERVSMIACHPATERMLRRLGFFLHRADAETLSVSCRDARLGAAIAAGAPWHLTGANTDRDE